MPPGFLTEVEAFYQSKKSEKQIAIPQEAASRILEDAPRTYDGPLAPLYEEGKIKRVAFLLSLFVLKRPDICYSSGMHNIVGVLLSVFPREIHAFCLFCHLVENVYPTVSVIQGYFSPENRFLVQHTEFRVLAMMGEHLRPLMVNSLRVPGPGSTAKRDHSAFILLIKRVGEVWFNSLFSQMLVPSELLRVWDNALIYSMDFLHKFALVILSKNERFIRTKIKAEAKVIISGSQLDTLIAAGNAVKQKLLAKIEKSAVESLIKKALTKPTYVSLTRVQFLSEARKAEGSYIERLNRLRETKEQLRNTNKEMDLESIATAFEALEDIESKGLVSRDAFMLVAGRSFRWSETDALRFFTSFDQQGEEQVDVRELKAALAVLLKGSLHDKLRACFMAFDIDGSGDLDPEEVIEMVTIIERCLDGRSSFFKSQSVSLYTSLGRNSEGKIPESAFVSAAETNPACKPILDFIQAIEISADPIGSGVAAMDLSTIEVTPPSIQSGSESFSPYSDVSEDEFSQAVERFTAEKPQIEETKTDKKYRRMSTKTQKQASALANVSRLLRSEPNTSSPLANNQEELVQKQKQLVVKQRQACARLCTRDMCLCF